MLRVSPFVLISLLMPFALSSCVDHGGGGLNAVRSTSIPVLFDGEDSGYKVLVHLANYSRTVQPTFGEDGDAELSEDGDTLTVRFHPTHRYSDTGGHGAADQYFLYVGLIAPPLSEDGEGGIIEGGMAERPSVKDERVHFRGEFRFDRGEAAVRKHLYLTPTLIYYGFDPQEYKQIAFNDYGGLEDHPMESLYFDYVEFGWSSGWHNVYWGDWWDDATCAPDPQDPNVPSDWIPFDVDLSAASDIAVAWANEEWKDREAPDDYFNVDDVQLWAAYLGPEYQIDEGELVFSVRNLGLTFDAN